MTFSFEFFLFLAVVISGAIALFDLIFLAPQRKKNQSTTKPFLVAQALSVFPILLLVFSARSFAYESYRIPSGSLKPTLLVGDFIIVNKYDYGIRLPVIHSKIIPINEPKRGDIVAFRKPTDVSTYLIKRVIGIPGDHITYTNKVLYINGQEIPQQFDKFSTDKNEDAESWQVIQKQENLLGIKHGIYQIPSKQNDDFETIVPKGKYFMMGDNRDVSADSRYWGFMPEENIIGKASRIWMSLDLDNRSIRWDRFGEKII